MGPAGAVAAGDAAVALLADRLAIEAGPVIEQLIDRIGAMLDAAGSLAEFRAMLLAGFPELDTTDLAAVLAQGLMVADAAGRLVVADGGDNG